MTLPHRQQGQLLQNSSSQGGWSQHRCTDGSLQLPEPWCPRLTCLSGKISPWRRTQDTRSVRGTKSPFQKSPETPVAACCYHATNRSLLSGDLEETPPLQNTLPWPCQEKPTTSTQLKPMPQTTVFHHPTLSDPQAGLEVEPTSSKVPLGQTLATPGLALPSVHQGNASPAIATSLDLASHLAWSPLEGDNTVPRACRKAFLSSKHETKRSSLEKPTH